MALDPMWRIMMGKQRDGSGGEVEIVRDGEASAVMWHLSMQGKIIRLTADRLRSAVYATEAEMRAVNEVLEKFFFTQPMRDDEPNGTGGTNENGGA